MNAHELTVRMRDLLGRLRANTQSAEEQELLAAAIDAIQDRVESDLQLVQETGSPVPSVVSEGDEK